VLVVAAGADLGSGGHGSGAVPAGRPALDQFLRQRLSECGPEAGAYVAAELRVAHDLLDQDVAVGSPEDPPNPGAMTRY
jgi:hypothetical protein